MLSQILAQDNKQMLNRSSLGFMKNRSSLGFMKSTTNNFGNFIYKDHVTRKQYDVQDLKRITSTMFTKEKTDRSKKTFNYRKSTDSISKKNQKFYTSNEDIQLRKNELNCFLQQLKMMERIRRNRNHIVSGTQKAQQRRSMLPSIMQIMSSKSQKQQNIDLLKHKIRKQVSSLNTSLFRDYIEKKQPYRPVFNQLNIASTRGALNNKKIRQIKEKIKQCSMKGNKDGNFVLLNRKKELDSKENQFFEEYFKGVREQLDKQIHQRMRHEASYNWKHGRHSSIEDMFKQHRQQSNPNVR